MWSSCPSDTPWFSVSVFASNVFFLFPPLLIVQMIQRSSSAGMQAVYRVGQGIKLGQPQHVSSLARGTPNDLLFKLCQQHTSGQPPRGRVFNRQFLIQPFKVAQQTENYVAGRVTPMQHQELKYPDVFPPKACCY